MGRRSINTTKSGKYMNPTDQARKEARKKELKKNKRQRQLVRAAVLKNKDPGQILEEMEKIDEMEYNVMQPSPLNEKVLRDKRKKLKETFDRVMRLYHNDEPEHWAELKRKEVEYEKKRMKKQQYYESVKHAQSVQIDDIPLPSQTNAGANNNLVSFTGLPARMPPPPTALSLPAFAPSAPPGTMKKTTEVKTKTSTSTTPTESKRKDPLGVPPGPPPNLMEMSDLDSDVEESEIVLKEYNPKVKQNRKDVPKPNSLQQRMLAISGQNIDEFMKEMENVHKKKEKERETTKKSNSADDEDLKSDDEDSRSSGIRSRNSSDSSDSEPESSEKRQRKESPPPVAAAAVAAAAVAAAAAPSSIPVPLPLATAPHIMLPAPPMPPLAAIPPPMMFRPPPLRPPGNLPGYGIRLATGAPPVPRSAAIGGMPTRMGIRMPPGPPPGMPPRMPHHQAQHKAGQQGQKDTKGITTITAKPQIRNLSADVTRFVPSTLRIKREEVRKPNKTKQFAMDLNKPATEGHKAVTKDDAYLQFMNEMQGLL